jgi:hypothetical protein
MAKPDTNNAFRIQFPEGWEDRTIHCFMGPEDGGVQHLLHVLVDRDLRTSDVQEYARDRIDQILESMPNPELVKEEEKTLSMGASAYEAVYKWVSSSDKVTFQKLVYVIHKGVAYSFSANFSRKTIKTLAAEVDAMVDSFEP